MRILGVLALGLAAGGWFLLAAQGGEQVAVAYRTSLLGRTPNQRFNAALALVPLNGKVIPPGATFSFNKTVGSFAQDDGYRKAPVSYNGQLITTWGGGVCQTSTTLYNAALLAGLQIIERHAHQFAPSYVPPGRDAAVAYENIDLKFRNPYPFQLKIRARKVGDALELAFLSGQSLPQQSVVRSDVKDRLTAGVAEVGDGDKRRMRNRGKDGFDVEVFRTLGQSQERISHNRYPAMHRVIQRS
jgi:vancomycin resistance protein YoaR